jgi:uncharacterized membrane protein
VTDIEGGVPMSNYWGWFKCGFLCCIIYQLILGSAPSVKRSVYLDVYGPLMLYANMLMFIGGFTVVFLKRMDVILIGISSAGAMFLVALAKLYLLRSGIEFSPAYAWLKKEALVERPASLEVASSK